VLNEWLVLAEAAEKADGPDLGIRICSLNGNNGSVSPGPSAESWDFATIPKWHIERQILVDIGRLQLGFCAQSLLERPKLDREHPLAVGPFLFQQSR